MKDGKLLWSAFGGTWIIFIAFASWSAREHNALRTQMTAIDKDQAVRMMRLETELKQINCTLMEIKTSLK